jgi:hypothetical protein
MRVITIYTEMTMKTWKVLSLELLYLGFCIIYRSNHFTENSELPWHPGLNFNFILSVGELLLFVSCGSDVPKWTVINHKYDTVLPLCVTSVGCWTWLMNIKSSLSCPGLFPASLKLVEWSLSHPAILLQMQLCVGTCSHIPANGGVSAHWDSNYSAGIFQHCRYHNVLVLNQLQYKFLP